MPHRATALQIDRTQGASPKFVRYTVTDEHGLVAPVGVRMDRDHPDFALYLEAFFRDHPGPATGHAPSVVAKREPLRLL